MTLPKLVHVQLLHHTWVGAQTIPPRLLALANASPISVDVDGVFLFIGVFTRPPVQYGFSLSDCWAWLRYFPAIDADPSLRFRQEWSTLDPHHKTVCSGDFGVGFSTWILSRALNFVHYVDTLYVVNVVAPGVFQLGRTAARGPRKAPDYIAITASGEFSILECKGTQTDSQSLMAALNRGTQQKANVHVQHGRGVSMRHSLAAGIFVPQWGSSEEALFGICDPAWDDIVLFLESLSREELGRAAMQVSLSKALAFLQLTNTANTMVRAKGSSESLTEAIDRDLAQDRPFGPSRVPAGVRVEREYLWPEATRLIADRLFVGVRISAELPARRLEALQTADRPELAAEQEWTQISNQRWRIESVETGVRLLSPFDITYDVVLLEA